MYAVRGIAISVSVFVLVYTVLSILVGSAWRTALPCALRWSSRQAAQILFDLRVFPVAFATAITAFYVIPSFLLLEPRFVAEPLGNLPVIGTLLGAALAISGIVKAAFSLYECSRAMRAWTHYARRVNRRFGLSVIRTSEEAPAVVAAGVIRPTLVLSDAALGLLTASEYRVAVRHELAHLRRKDNLKKLVLRFIEFPGMRDLERQWLRFLEMAADEFAVRRAEDAIDLASALIKVSRIGCAPPLPTLITALVQTPASLVRSRAERLLAWEASRQDLPRGLSPWYVLTGAAVLALPLVFTYGRLLVQVHAATEWLVR